MVKNSQLKQHQMLVNGMFKKYISAVHLLDEVGPWSNRLESIYRIVNAPTFLYVKSPTATYLLATLVNSSYWLHTELFNEDVIQKNANDKTLTGTQKAHVLLLDIGSTLIDKKFPLKPEMINTFCSKSSPAYSYAKTFLAQCRKRNAWTKETAVCKKTFPFCHQKENIHS